MASERVTFEMISKLADAFEEIELDVSDMDFFDNLEAVHRNAGRLVLLAGSYRDMPSNTIEIWFDEASEMYAILTHAIEEDEL